MSGRIAFATGAGTARLRRRKATSRFMLTLAGAMAALAVVPLVWILGYVFLNGVSAISPDFFTNLPTPVGVPGGGIVNAIAGSALTVTIGLLIAAPIGLLAAIFVASRSQGVLTTVVRFATDTLAGVPSIVMGIFAYTIVVLPQRHFSALAGGIVLAFIMLPIIIRSTEEMLRLVPSSLREGSLALGAAEWRTWWRVLLPAAGSGILTGVMLAMARAAGEAAPMLFTAFGNPFFSVSLDQPIATLPHTIYTYAISPYADWRSKAWATALVLIVLVFVLNALARTLSAWRARRLGTVTR
jgi:phosphate transport system permease protein